MASKGNSVLHSSLAGGPHGLGDPDDRRLRKVEMEILIPKKIRERTKAEKCAEEVAAFGECCVDNAFSFFWRCRPANAVMRSCMERWYFDEAFKQECKEQYLKERSEYRRTGVGQKMKKKEAVVY